MPTPEFLKGFSGKICTVEAVVLLQRTRFSWMFELLRRALRHRQGGFKDEPEENQSRSFLGHRPGSSVRHLLFISSSLDPNGVPAGVTPSPDTKTGVFI